MDSPNEPWAAHREPLGPSGSPRSVQHRIHGLGDEDAVEPVQQRVAADGEHALLGTPTSVGAGKHRHIGANRASLLLRPSHRRNHPMTRPLAYEPAPPDTPRYPPDDDRIKPAPEDGLMVSEKTYWADYYQRSEVRYEWSNGQLEEVPVSDIQTLDILYWLLRLLEHYLRVHPVARYVLHEVGFRLPADRAVRLPDLAVVRHDNPVPLRGEDNSYHGVFDLCVEALSDLTRRDILRDTQTKRAEYAHAGVPEYYILHHEPRHQAFYRRGNAGLYVPIAPVGGLIRSEVLPGFQFRPTDLLDRPDADAMRQDPVYAAFVDPQWREAEERAAKAIEALKATRERIAEADARTTEAEARATQAEARATQAEARAAVETEARRQLEQEIARLRARQGGSDSDG